MASKALQLPLFAPSSAWQPTQVSELPSWANAKRIAIDCETRDEQLKQLGPGTRRGAYPVGWSFAIEDGPSYYLPYRHEGGDNLPESEVLNYLRFQAKNFTGEIVGANLSYDLDYACNEGIEFPRISFFRDIQIADPLIYELHNSYSLDSIGKRFGIEAKDEIALIEAAKAFGVDPKGGMWRLPARYVGEYAQRDVVSPLEIYAKQRELLDRDELWGVFNLESKVLPVLNRMRRRGIRIDEDKLTQIEQWALKKETEALEQVFRETGYRIKVGDVWKSQVLAKAFEIIGVKLKKTAKGAPQIDADLLDNLKHPVAENIRLARKVNKMREAFAQSIRTYMINGRIHCTFNQIAREDEKGEQKGARFGRLSATDPNLQQQYNPEKEPELSSEWRKIFIPEEGAIYGSNDYSQQEPRWTTHFAAVIGLNKADDAAARYRNDPTTDNHKLMTEFIHGEEIVAAMGKAEFKTARGYAKNIFLGLCYGEGGAKLCNDLGLPTRWCLSINRNKEYFATKHEAYHARASRGSGYIYEAAGEKGQSIIDNFDRNVPYVRQIAQRVSQKANQVGYIKDIIGRRLHFPLKDDGTYDWAHKALNRLIQGTSATQMKMALVAIDAEGYFLQLQVHDEANGSYGSVEEALKVGKIMKECVYSILEPLVPFHVDTECGKSWGELELVK